MEKVIESYRANDGTVSTASLVVGVAATEAARQDVPVTGVAGLNRGMLAMLTTAAVGRLFGTTVA